jgi:hypothetical protein
MNLQKIENDGRVPGLSEIAKTKAGRKMFRQKAFWENYLQYASVKAEAIAENRREMLREER